MKKASVQYIVAVMITAFLAAPAFSQSDENAAKPEIRIMSFNVRLSPGKDGDNKWPYRRDLVVEVMKEFEPDFLGVQESWPDQIEYITENLPGIAHIGGSRELTENGEGAPLFYDSNRWQPSDEEQGMFWLSDTPEVRGSKTWNNICPRTVAWARFLPQNAEAGQGGVYVYNTHFSHMSDEARVKSAHMLAKVIAERKHADEPVFVTGDFNAGEDSASIRYLKGEAEGSPVKMIDTFRSVHPDAEKVGTFNGFKGNSDGAKIDYIFALPGTKVIEAEIIRTNKDGRYPSDHYPIMAVVR